MVTLNTATTLKNSTSIAIGGFDGMHRGHQELFSRLDTNSTIVVIDNSYACLTPNEIRKKHTSFDLKFYKLDKIKHLNAKEFLKLLKTDFPKLKKIVVGYDFHFGKDRAYSATYLKEIFDGEVVIVDEVKIDGISVHSRYIRELISKGDIKQANKLLGYNYTIYGELIRGQGLGSKELVATINLEAKEFCLPKEEVYASLTRVDGSEHLYPSVSFVGHRVSTDGSFAIESHILDTKVSCTQNASISFIDFLRDNKKFENLKELKEAIYHDINQAKTVLKQLSF